MLALSTSIDAQRSKYTHYGVCIEHLHQYPKMYNRYIWPCCKHRFTSHCTEPSFPYQAIWQFKLQDEKRQLTWSKISLASSSVFPGNFIFISLRASSVFFMVSSSLDFASFDKMFSVCEYKMEAACPITTSEPRKSRVSENSFWEYL